MSDDADWGPWVDHDGKGCPLPDGTVCQIECRCGVIGVITVHHASGVIGDCFVWDSLPPEWAGAAIIRYRVRRPKALRDLIALIETLPAPAPQPERMPEEVAP